MSSSVVRSPDSSLLAALRLALLFAAIKLVLQFALTLWSQHIGYSYFRDEFYYIACGRHLAWGFVDHGPIVALQARLGELLFGDSLFAIRILSALAGAATVFLTGLLAWTLGGLRLTQQRRILFTRWAAVGIALIIVIALPYVLWQIHNHWPTLEFFHNGKVGNKNVILGPMGFFLAQLSQMHPVNALVWITGLISLLRARSIPHGRWIGLTFLIFYMLMFVLH